ncbi:hypothetical protein BLNAU_18866 [Blattamonas nauphoetae]|uniref:Uncharacterized protein n=1 Tax=Blattamonas nauphoetae TaxID=2049346 RepID=A0ABQ9X348_9EUKA|nr:hypothetical protein BLNAU_18866 [Blattamonas nauphoetae]
MFARLCTLPVQSASTHLPSHPLPSSDQSLSDIEEVIRGYSSSLRNCSEKETLPILSQIRTFLESDLDELPSRCAIAESCGLVSILSGIASSHSSIGLKSVASGMLAFVQNAIGSRDIQTTVHAMNDQLVELRTTVCNMATQLTEQFGRIDSRLMKHDLILNRLDDKRRFNMLQQSRFQRWSKQGADAVEIYDEDFIIRTGNTFRLRQRPKKEDTNFIPKTLFSPIICSDVAHLSFSIVQTNEGYRYGALSSHLIDTGTKSDFDNEYPDVACWGSRYIAGSNYPLNGARPQRKFHDIVLETDCRDGQPLFRHMKDSKVGSIISVNLSLPFRFAIQILHPSVSVTVKSLTFTAKPTLKGERETYNFRN